MIFQPRLRIDFLNVTEAEGGLNFWSIIGGGGAMKIVIKVKFVLLKVCVPVCLVGNTIYKREPGPRST